MILLRRFKVNDMGRHARRDVDTKVGRITGGITFMVEYEREWSQGSASPTPATRASRGKHR